jgi:DNA-binding protein H-NS
MSQVFVKIENYEDIKDIMELAKDRLKQAIQLLEQIAELKQNEDAELAAWTDNLNEISANVEDIDRALKEQ